MTTSELLNTLNRHYPFELAESWDNIGLLIGDKNKNVENVFLSLDVTSYVLDQVKEDSTLITHHPLIFQSFKEIDFNSYHGKLIKKIIQKNINYIALHTNYDKAFLNEYFVKYILGIDFYKKEDMFIYFSVKNKDKKEFVSYIKEKLKLENLQFVDSGNKEVSYVAVCTGSGSSMLREAKKNGADFLLTGDITYHTAMEAKELGISILDITHFHSEKHFGIDLESDLLRRGLNVFKIRQTDPFMLV